MPPLRKRATDESPPLPWAWLAAHAGTSFDPEDFEWWWHFRIFGIAPCADDQAAARECVAAAALAGGTWLEYPTFS